MKCKKCGNTSFSYVEGKRKGAPWYISVLLIVISVICLTLDGEKLTWSPYVGVFTFLFIIINKGIKRKTGTKAICNNCQKIKFI